MLELSRPSQVNFGSWKGPPVVTIDGIQEHDVTWGRNVRSVTPSLHEITITFIPPSDDSQTKKAARAPKPSKILVDTRYGPQTVYYARSWNGWVPGAIGLTPQKSPGYFWLLVQLAIIIGALLGCLGTIWLGVYLGNHPNP